MLIAIVVQMRIDVEMVYRTDKKAVMMVISMEHQITVIILVQMLPHRPVVMGKEKVEKHVTMVETIVIPPQTHVEQTVHCLCVVIQW